ncbi:MAG: hypothetical protein ABMA01_04700 [Chthoniobacteraceae bacterium]
MARTNTNGTNTSAAAIGFEAGKESSPELQLARATREGQPCGLTPSPIEIKHPPDAESQFRQL